MYPVRTPGGGAWGSRREAGVRGFGPATPGPRNTGTGADTGTAAGTDADPGAVPYVDICIGERLGMGSTAMGRELDVWGRMETRERVPIASTPVASRSPMTQLLAPSCRCR